MTRTAATPTVSGTWRSQDPPVPVITLPYVDFLKWWRWHPKSSNTGKKNSIETHGGLGIAHSRKPSYLPVIAMLSLGLKSGHFWMDTTEPGTCCGLITSIRPLSFPLFQVYWRFVYCVQYLMIQREIQIQEQC